MVKFDYLFDYTPYFNGGANDHMSRILLSFKRNHQSAFEFMRSVMVNFFDVSDFEKGNTVICAVPSHDGSLYHPVQRLCTHIAHECGFIDGAHLVRKMHPTASFCRTGERDPLALQASIEIDGMIAGRHVILLDDIATTGTSFAVVSRLLIKGGALSVRCVALGRTIRLKQQERGQYA